MSLKKILAERETWRGVLVILALSFFLSAVVNFGLIKRFLAGEFRQAFVSPGRHPGLVFVSLAETEDLWHSGLAVFIDSRAAADFARGHIPGAISVPLEEIKKGNLSLLEKIPRDRLLVIYCEGGDCQTSLLLAEFLSERGYRDLRVFSGGWTEWTGAEMPVSGGDEKPGK